MGKVLVGCTGKEFHCELDSVIFISSILCLSIFLLYMILYIFYIQKSANYLKKRSYTLHRLENIIFRIQVFFEYVIKILNMKKIKTGRLSNFFILGSIMFLWFLDFRSCESFILTWLGLMPAQVVMSCLVITRVKIHIPIKPTQEDYALDVNN